MKLDALPLGKLSISKANMRYARKAPDVSDILPTVRARGVLVPLIVRPNCGEGAFEIVAGARRFTAAKIVADAAANEAEDSCEPVTLPCAILDEGDDAAAIEASLIENVARRDADEVSQWTTFVRLIKEGRSVADSSSLAAGSAAVEAVGLEIGVDMADYWQADDALFESLRDKEVLTAIVAELAGTSTAAAHSGEKGKTLKPIIRDYLEGTGGRAKAEGWVPRWMAFPPSAYSARGGVGSVDAAALVAAARADSQASQAPKSESEPARQAA